jgi:hypothetical protein
MRRLAFLLGLVALFAVLAQQAAAGTTNVSVSMSFTEPFLYDANSGCPGFTEGFCGNGVAVPFGHATEMIVFGGACGGTCDFRTVTVAGGSIYIDESFSNFQCPGVCQPGQNGRGFPGSGTLTDVVVGGTGMFVGATGNLSGSVSFAGAQSQIKLAGTITLQT